MSRHVLDRSRTPSETRAQKFLEAEKREGLHPATRSLIRRARPADPARTRAFLKIARAGTAEV